MVNQAHAGGFGSELEAGRITVEGQLARPGFHDQVLQFVLVAVAGDCVRPRFLLYRIGAGIGKGTGAGIGPANNATFWDKEWITVDNNEDSAFHGRAYLAATRFKNGLQGSYIDSPSFLSYSDEGGLTWTEIKEISGSNADFCTYQETGPAGECDEDQASVPEVAPDGTLVVAWDQDTGPAPADTFNHVLKIGGAPAQSLGPTENPDVSLTHWAGQYVSQDDWPAICGPAGYSDGPVEDAEGKDCNVFHGDYTVLAVGPDDSVNVVWTGLNRFATAPQVDFYTRATCTTVMLRMPCLLGVRP